MVFPWSQAFFPAEKRSRLSRGTSEIECGHISDPDKKENVMKELLKFQPPKTARLNAAEYTNFNCYFQRPHNNGVWKTKGVAVSRFPDAFE